MRKILIAAMFGMMLTSCGNNESTTAKEETNMTFLELAEKRFSVRRYEKTPVEQEKIDAILRAHSWLQQPRTNSRRKSMY